MNDLKMHDVPKAAWCELLNDPTILQVTGKLYGPVKVAQQLPLPPNIVATGQHGYCCLGVLAKSQGASFEFEQVTEHGEDGDYEVTADEATVSLPTWDPARDLNDNEVLDEDFAASLGLTPDHQSFLSTLNDGGEAAVARTSMFFALYQKYAESEGATRPGNDDSKRLFKIRKHSFAEIRNVILVEF